MHASRVGYDVLRVAGAGYLVWLGVQSLRTSEAPPAGDPASARAGLVGTGYRAGLITNVLNPKVGVFFVTFLPGFIPHGSPVGATSLLFGAIAIAINLVYQLPLVALAHRVTAWLGRPVIRRRMEVTTGAVLIGFGARLAFEG